MVYVSPVRKSSSSAVGADAAGIVIPLIVCAKNRLPMSSWQNMMSPIRSFDTYPTGSNRQQSHLCTDGYMFRPQTRNCTGLPLWSRSLMAMPTVRLHPHLYVGLIQPTLEAPSHYSTKATTYSAIHRDEEAGRHR